jgi:hypothetical protein
VMTACAMLVRVSGRLAFQGPSRLAGLLQIAAARALFAPVRAANVTVGSRDPQIVYTGTWVDQDNGGHQFTGQHNASAAFTFQGVCLVSPRRALAC